MRIDYNLSVDNKMDVNNQIIKSSLSNLGSGFVLVSKIRIKTWKGVLIIGFIAGFAASLMLGASYGWLSKIKGVAPTAGLSLAPSSVTYNVGDEFSVDILLSTDGHSVVAISTYLDFDSNALEVVSIDYIGSVFPDYMVEDVFDNTQGTIKITRGEPAPGVNINGGKVATIHFRALAETAPGGDNVTFVFIAPEASGDSNVHLNDGSCPTDGSGAPCTGASDVLGIVAGGKYIVQAPACSPYNMDIAPLPSGDGFVDFLDLGQYVNWYKASDNKSDVNCGAVDFVDLGKFINCYKGGAMTCN